MGAGILPVAVHQGQLYFLFGQEHDTRDWSDFGGGKQLNETPHQNAIREGCEELCGFLGSKAEIGRLIQTRTVLKVAVDGYTTFLVHVPFDPHLPFYFNNHFKFIKTNLPGQVGKGGLFEKSHVHWFSLNHLMTTDIKFRPFYRRVLTAVIHQLPNMKFLVKLPTGL